MPPATKVQNRYKALIRKAGADPGLYGTHSLRRGGATWALKCGLSADVIKLLGDWKSSAYQVPFGDRGWFTGTIRLGDSVVVVFGECLVNFVNLQTINLTKG